MTASRRATPEPRKRPRTVDDALCNAERIRSEIGRYVQPSPEDFDMVLLADEVFRLIVLNDKLREIGESIAAYADKLQKKLTAARRKARK
jgi:hypothetical protein